MEQYTIPFYEKGFQQTHTHRKKSEGMEKKIFHANKTHIEAPKARVTLLSDRIYFKQVIKETNKVTS